MFNSFNCTSLLLFNYIIIIHILYCTVTRDKSLRTDSNSVWNGKLLYIDAAPSLHGTVVSWQMSM